MWLGILDLVNNTLNQIDLLINKAYDIIKDLDNAYDIEVYTPEVIPNRGYYGFNIIPMQVIPRVASAERDLQNMVIDIFMHYDMDADDDFKTSWTKFMTRAQAVIVALFDKQNFISGVSDLEIGADFNNTIIEKERIISLTIKCEYKIFASR